MLSDEAGESLRNWIALRTGLVTGWEDQPEDYAPDDYIRLRVGPMTRVGRDGVRWSKPPGQPEGAEMVPTVIGQREFTLTVVVKAWSQELSQTAEVPLSQLELALQMPSFQQLLLDLNLGLIGTGPIVQSDMVIDDRVQSGAAMDIRFATSIHLTDADEGQGYIATADVETTLQGGAGGDIVLTDQVGDV